jgi:hypothetical protein
MTRKRRGVWRRLRRNLTCALVLSGLLLLPSGATPPTVQADQIGASGEVIGADVEGTICLDFVPYGGALSGRIEMTVTFDCRGKIRDEHHVLEITKGSVDGDRIQATAVYVDRSGLPKDELSRCKSAYETYQTREDSRRLIGTVDADGQRASGTLGEYRPTVTWRIDWQQPTVPEEPPAEVTPVDQPALDPAETVASSTGP